MREPLTPKGWHTAWLLRTVRDHSVKATQDEGMAMVTKVRPKIDDEGMFSTFNGPAAVVRNCKCCKHFELVKKGLRGAGRSYGFVAGNKARGLMIQHFKAAHPERYAELGKEAKARAAAANERLGA